MAIAIGFQYIALMKTLDSHYDCNSEKTPTTVSCKMNGVWIDNIFMLGPNSLVGSIASMARVIGWGGLGKE
jgi:hypothetical protein